MMQKRFPPTAGFKVLVDSHSESNLPLSFNSPADYCFDLHLHLDLSPRSHFAHTVASLKVS